MIGPKGEKMTRPDSVSFFHATVITYPLFYRNVINKLILGGFLVMFILAGCNPAPEKNVDRDNPEPSRTFDVIVDTDLGGDPDDIQSLFRLVHYSDILKVKGIVSTPCTQLESHPWDTIPRKKLIGEWIRRIDVGHLREMGHPQLMKEQELLGIIKSGSQTPGPPSRQRTSEGSKWLIRQAKDHSREDPLWVLVWGSMTTVAQALYEVPDIASRIRIYSIGSTNTQHDSLSRDFVYALMEKQYPSLWWIENGILPKWSHETFRGVYQGGDQEGDWANTRFIGINIRGHGSTHQGFFKEKCGDVFPVANWPENSLKEGDSPSLLFLIGPVVANIGDPDDPTGQSWGGQFRKAYPEKFPNYYVDLDLPPEECQATINRWRKDFLSDWKKRWDWYGDWENGR
jgi:hypothetical protein